MERSLRKLSMILGPALIDTAYMVFFAMILSTIFGFLIAVSVLFISISLPWVSHR